MNTIRRLIEQLDIMGDVITQPVVHRTADLEIVGSNPAWCWALFLIFNFQLYQVMYLIRTHNEVQFNSQCEHLKMKS